MNKGAKNANSAPETLRGGESQSTCEIRKALSGEAQPTCTLKVTCGFRRAEFRGGEESRLRNNLGKGTERSGVRSIWGTGSVLSREMGADCK